MQTDFFDAHGRHWADAESLFAEGRLANADHHYGIAAECGLKRLMLHFGMTMNQANDSPNQRDDRKHVDGIWSRFEAYRSGHDQGVGYALSSENPFHDWHVAQRYVNQSSFTQTRVKPHQNGANLVCALVKKALKDGLI